MPALSVQGSDGMVVSLDPQSGSFLSAHGLGGSANEMVNAVRVDGTGTIRVAGRTNSTDAVFPNVEEVEGFAVSGTSSFVAAFTPVTSDPPTADAGLDQVGNEGDPITFDASNSSDPESGPLTYFWDFGDGQTAQTTAPVIDHTYDFGDEFEVNLTVTDDTGNQATDMVMASIAEVNDVPLADPQGPYNGFADIAVTFDGSNSSDFDNVDGTTANDQTLEYNWDFGDGTIVSTSNSTYDHTYSSPGDYDVLLTVSDGESNSDAALASASIASAPTGDPHDIYAWEITSEFRSRGKHTDYRFAIDVNRDSDANGQENESDEAAAGVLVTVELLDSNGVLIETLSGTTNSEGIFNTDWIRGLASGTYTATIDLTHNTFAWNELVGSSELELIVP